MKKYSIILVLVVLVLLTVFLGHKKDKNIKYIGILLPADIQLLNDVVDGIKMAFKNEGYVENKDVVFDVESSHGDNSTLQSLASKFATGNCDIIIPTGTGASQSIFNLVKEKPIVFSAVTDPKTAGLVENTDKPGKNITGTSDVTLYKESLELLVKLVPGAKKVGIIQNPGEPNSVFALSETKKYAKAMGLDVLVGSANNSSEVYPSAKALASKVDAFYMLPDVTVASGVDGFIKASLETKKPIIVFGDGDVKKGGLASLGTNYVKVGQKTGEIAVKILKGEKPGNIPVRGVTDADIFLNRKTAEMLGLKIPDDILKSAKQIY